MAASRKSAGGGEAAAQSKKISCKGAKPQRSARKLNEVEIALLCALAPLREAVDFFTTLLRPVASPSGKVETERIAVLSWSGTRRPNSEDSPRSGSTPPELHFHQTPSATRPAPAGPFR